jgi:hypothetical protein
MGVIGYKHTEETRKRMSETRKRLGIVPPSSKGKKMSDGQKQKISIANKKAYTNPDLKKKTSERQRGELSHRWKGGFTDIKISIRNSFVYRQWRSDVFTRDGYTCVLCGSRGGKLNADHIVSFSVIFNKNNIKTLDSAILCSELWNINNGRTLCEDCHKLTDNFGGKARNKHE